MTRRTHIGMPLAALLLTFSIVVSSVLGVEGPGAKSPGRTRDGRARKYVYLKLDGPIPERNPLLYIMPPKNMPLRQVIDAINKAKADNSVTGILVHIGSPQVGWARAQEIRAALHSCRLAGKRIVCFMEGGGNVEYYIASVADRLGMVPAGSVFLVGLRAEIMFYKGVLDKLGVHANFVQIGKYKGAAEPFTRTEMSQPFRESVELMLDDFYKQIVDDVARGRDFKAELVEALIDRGPFTAKTAHNAGLIDDIAYYDEFLDRLRAESPSGLFIVRGYVQKPVKIPDPLQLLNLFKGAGVRKPSQLIPTTGDVIAVIYAVGPIVMGDGGDDLFGTPVVSVNKLVQIIRVARNTPNVKAVVLRINSPGGSALASDIIWHELVRTNEKKPLIVSMSDVAASGGYYIAVAGRTIVAEPGTMTGSIGVVGGKFNLKGLYDKVGLSVSVIQRGRNAGLYSGVSDFTENQRERVKTMMTETYGDFLNRVAKGRNKTVSQVDAVAQGQAWSGQRALSIGLVDKLGGLDVAIDIARKEAHIPAGAPVKVVELPPSRSIFEQLFGMDIFNLQAAVPRLQLYGFPIKVPAAAKALVHIMEKEHVVWMAPYELTIK